MNPRPFYFLFLGFLCFLNPGIAYAQKGEIAGRVLGEDGNGLPNVQVMLYPIGVSSKARAGGGARSDRQTTDEEGNFKFTDLTPRLYAVNVFDVKGYVQALPPSVDNVGNRYRIGETAQIRMIRGGVITGKVTTATGEPMIGVPVAPLRVRDSEGRPVDTPYGGRPRLTDDRGIYRLYGLQPGAYLISVRTTTGLSDADAAYDGMAPTYHPSAARETATEVAVTNGGEAAGVDIRYRGDFGHRVSGVVSGDIDQTTPYPQGIQLSLVSVTTGALSNSGYTMPSQENNGFTIYGVVDGEYEVYAFRPGMNGAAHSMSTPHRITVRGADVGGLSLKLYPRAILQGTLSIESAKPACEQGRKAAAEEINLTARREQPARSSNAPIFITGGRDNVAIENGEFQFQNLGAGKYFLSADLPNDQWYVKSILVPGAGPRPRAGSPASIDLALTGITTQLGAKYTGVVVTVAEGGSSLQGKIAPAAEGASLPARMRIHLVPAEPGSHDQLTRYAETMLLGDRTFLFKNLAPGKYLVLARPIPDAEPVDAPRLPTAYDAGERTKLRKDAESRKIEVELKSCQPMKDFLLRW